MRTKTKNESGHERRSQKQVYNFWKRLSLTHTLSLSLSCFSLFLCSRVSSLFLRLLFYDFFFPGDCGVFSPLFLCVHQLSPGSSLFVPANTPHAYISGEILECQARSDNVIRCGLTPKFKDVEVLCDSLSYDTTPQVPGEGEDIGRGTKLYRPPVVDFEVRITQVVEGEKEEVVVDDGVDSGTVLLVLEGECTVKGSGGREGGGGEGSGEETMEVKRGQALFVSASTKLTIKCGEGKGVKFVRAMRNLK